MTCRPLPSSALGAALRYAFDGALVFPLQAGAKRPHALTPHGFKDASRDAAVIRQWFHVDPLANLAIVTGEASGVLVVDVDPRNSGDASLAALPKLPATRRALTGGGGQHLFYRWPTTPHRTGANVLGPGLDIKSTGGYVVAPPSTHPSGAPYAWENEHAPIVELPRWALDLIAPKAPAPARISTSRPTTSGRAWTVEDRARAYVAKLPGAVAGSGGHRATYAAALALVRGFELPFETALDLLAREFNARCSPPWSLEELRHKVDSAATSASAPPFGYLLTDRRSR